jgi:uncharacterized metal-binding protein
MGICKSGLPNLGLENAIREFAKQYMDKVIQMSACTAAVFPLLIQISWVDPSKLISVNGCRNNCCDIILSKGGANPKISIVADDIIKREMGKCQSTSSFVFPDLTEEEAKKFALALVKAVNELRA